MITIELEPETEAELKRKAEASGTRVDAYVQELIEKHVNSGKILDELLAPFRRQVSESGISDDELDELIEEAREEIYQEKLAATRDQE